MTLGDKKIIYTGEDVPSLGITRGMLLSDVLSKIITPLVSLLSQKVSLNNIADEGNSDAVVPLVEGIQAVINKVGNLSTDDIQFRGSASEVTSSAVGPLLGKTLKYNTVKSPVGTSFDWDLTSDLVGLPNGYNVMRTKVYASGATSNGSTLLFDSNKSNDTHLIGNERFPINVSMEVVVRTPNGDVKLTKDAYIPLPETNSYTQTYQVVDTTNKVSNAQNLTEFVDMVQKQTDINNSKIDNIANISVNGVGRGIESVVNGLKASNDTITKEVEAMKVVEYNDENGQIKKGSVQSFIDSNKSIANAIVDRVASVEKEVNDVKGQI